MAVKAGPFLREALFFPLLRGHVEPLFFVSYNLQNQPRASIKKITFDQIHPKEGTFASLSSLSLFSLFLSLTV